MGFLSEFDLNRTRLEIVCDDKKEGVEDVRKGSLVLGVEER